MYSPFKARTRALLLVAAFSFIGLTGCDSGEPGVEGSVTFEGRTDVATTAATQSPVPQAYASAPIEGAVVTAATASSSGQLQALGGSATTDAAGTFRFESEATASPVVITAEGDDTTVRALIEAGASASATVVTPPLSEETDGETAVYLAGRTQGRAFGVADVAVYVTSELAVRVRSGAASAASVAAAIESGREAEEAYAKDENGGDASDDEIRQADEERRDDYAALRATLHAATTVSARDAAIRSFEAAYADAYAEAGLSAEARAKAAQTAARATVRFSADVEAEAALVLRKQAEVFAATTTGLAVEAAFQAAGASSAMLETLAQVRASLVADIRAAASASAIVSAKDAYHASVRAEISTETGISATALTAAEATTAAAETTFNTAVSAATSAQAVVDATMTFYTSARVALEASLGASAEAELAAEVLLLLAAS